MATPAEIIDSEKDAGRSAPIGESYEVAIEKLVYGGDGLAHVGSQAVFVPLAAAGDFARIRIVECERNYARGVIEELLDPSPLRRTPPCFTWERNPLQQMRTLVIDRIRLAVEAG